MKPPVFDYFSPASVEEALTLLGEHGEGAKLLAGGQSLMPALNFRLAAPAVLIDLNPIGALAGVHVASDGRLVAGAMTRHRWFETSALIQQRLPLVQHAMASVAHVAIRNRGTIGGSLCHADPAAEWPALCLACDAEMVLQSGTGLRYVKAGDFSRGLFTTALGGAEILVQVIFPAWPETRRWGFQELARRRGDFALVGVACLLDVDTGGTCTDVRIVVFGATDTPVLLREAASELTGRAPTDHHVCSAARCARGGIDCRSDHHASAEYRSELVQALTSRAIAQALARGNDVRDG